MLCFPHQLLAMESNVCLAVDVRRLRPSSLARSIILFFLHQWRYGQILITAKELRATFEERRHLKCCTLNQVFNLHVGAKISSSEKKKMLFPNGFSFVIGEKEIQGGNGAELSLLFCATGKSQVSTRVKETLSELRKHFSRPSNDSD